MDFAFEKQHNGISPPLARKFGVVDIAGRHAYGAAVTATCEGIMLAFVIVFSTFFSVVLISEFSLG
jgi:hypothetical protein